MSKNKTKHLLTLSVALALMPMIAACNTNLADLLDQLDLSNISITINNAINAPQTVDPRDLTPPSGFGPRGNSINIEPGVIFVNDISTDLVGVNLPDITLLGFENVTGFDIYIEYTVDGVDQSVLVLDGETVLLDYPCITDLEILTEEDYDPVSGDFVQAFDLTGSVFLNPDDFICGDAFIITIDPTAIEAGAQSISLS